MRKQLITVLLMMIWLCQLSGRYFVMFEFYLNQEYIAQNLCVNKDKPQLHCNGRCHLKKQLNEEEKRDQNNPERRTDNRSEIFYDASFYVADLTPAYTTLHTHYNNPACIGTPVDQAFTIFHPPGA
ncbi:hypothetical protein [Chitinophaga sp. YR627]|uniref:hypothetical protein n=1 Tax=Chitinophaga sp. YR627 TaxID=1881041 RepID=UPI000AA82394|nr:hypothetical protein [Chitinophaga sp. YR627]